MALEFTRIAQELVYKTIKQSIVDTIGFDSNKIFLMSPAHQYVNSRTETVDGLEQDRFPALAINSIKQEYNYSNNGTVQQQDSYTSTNPTKIWTSDIIVHETLEFCVLTTTKKEYRYWNNAFVQYFKEKRNGLLILNDLLPESSEYMNIILRNNTENQEDDLNDSTFIVEVRYRIFKEVMAYLMLNYDLYLKLEHEMDIDTNLDLIDPMYQQWS